MINNGYSNDELRDIVENEGLGYAVQDYVNPEFIEDQDLREKWEQAKNLLDEIEEALNVSYS